MSQRNSGYARKPLDAYQTPAWVVEAVIPHLPKFAKVIWEPACGEGDIVRVLADNKFDVVATDIVDGEDFFSFRQAPENVTGILSNPPFENSAVFIQHALDLMQARGGFVAMLLSANYDSAKTRRHLFADCPMFHKVVVLTKRIVWFRRTDGKREAPSENHRWFLWSYRRRPGPPTIRWAP